MDKIIRIFKKFQNSKYHSKDDTSYYNFTVSKTEQMLHCLMYTRFKSLISQGRTHLSIIIYKTDFFIYNHQQLVDKKTQWKESSVTKLSAKAQLRVTHLTNQNRPYWAGEKTERFEALTAL